MSLALDSLGFDLERRVAMEDLEQGSDMVRWRVLTDCSGLLRRDSESRGGW